MKLPEIKTGDTATHAAICDLCRDYDYIFDTFMAVLRGIKPAHHMFLRAFGEWCIARADVLENEHNKDNHSQEIDRDLEDAA